MEKKSNQHENNDYQCDYNELNYFDNKKQTKQTKTNDKHQTKSKKSCEIHLELKSEKKFFLSYIDSFEFRFILFLFLL